MAKAPVTIETGLAGGPTVSSVVGAAMIQFRFKHLGLNMQKRIARAAVSKVASKMVKAAKKQMAHEKDITGAGKTFETGLLRASIGKRMWTRTKAKWVVGATIGPRVGWGRYVVRAGISRRGKVRNVRGAAAISKFYGLGGEGNVTWSDPARYGHLVEGGSKRTKHGSVEERPFMEHTLLQSKDVMLSTMRTELLAGINREVAKLRAKR